MAQRVVFCRLSGTHEGVMRPVEDCERCLFRTWVVYCTVHKVNVPLVLCESCLLEGEKPCSMRRVLKGEIPFESIKDRAPACSLPQIIKQGIVADTDAVYNLACKLSSEGLCNE
jgi:hypothetical protein